MPSQTLWTDSDPTQQSVASEFVALQLVLLTELNVHQWNFEAGVDRTWSGYGADRDDSSLLYVLFTKGADGSAIDEPESLIRLTNALLKAGADPTIHNFAIFRAVSVRSQ